MAGFPFKAGEMEPVVQVGENVRLIPSPSDRFYVVKQIEPIQPKIVDFCGADFIGGTLPANGVAGYISKGFEMDTELAIFNGQLARYRVIPIDDIIVVVSHHGASNQLYTTKFAETYITKDKPRHSRSAYQAGAVAVDVILWTDSNNTDAGRRKARLKKLNLSEESGAAAILRLGDGATAGGATANAANAVASVLIGASETLIVEEDELAEYEFLTGIAFQTSAGNLRITATIEEDNPGSLPHYCDLFVWEDDVPYIKVINPEEVYAQTTARVMFPGERYVLESIAKPAKWTDIPVSKAPTPG